MNRKIGSMYLFFAILTLIGNTMEGSYLLVNLNETKTDGYTYFGNHTCEGKFIKLANYLDDAKFECNRMGKCGCIWTNMVYSDLDCNDEWRNAFFYLFEGTRMSEVSNPELDFCSWAKS